MEKELFDAIVEELSEVQTIEELDAIRKFGMDEQNAYLDPSLAEYFKAAEDRLKPKPPVQGMTAKEKLAEMLRQLEELRRSPMPTAVAPVARGGKRYRIVKFEVEWSTTPQVHAIMRILAAHAKVGDVLEEEAIVRMMEANVLVLDTRQPAKRIWDYYKGEHDRGLMAHGNIVRVP